MTFHTVSKGHMTFHTFTNDHMTFGTFINHHVTFGTFTNDHVTVDTLKIPSCDFRPFTSDHVTFRIHSPMTIYHFIHSTFAGHALFQHKLKKIHGLQVLALISVYINILVCTQKWHMIHLYLEHNNRNDMSLSDSRF